MCKKRGRIQDRAQVSGKNYWAGHGWKTKKTCRDKVDIEMMAMTE